MRRTTLVLLALALLLGGVGPAAAQNNPAITANENGLGTLQFPSQAPIPLPGILGVDTGPGGRPNALIYNLLGPPGLVTGDVFVRDPSGAQTDLIRFNNGPNGGEFVFYSLPGGTDLADLAGFPTANYPNTATALENGAGIISYTPTSTQPGFVSDGFSVSYTLTSPDPATIATIPEPSSLVLFGMATASCLGWRRWRMQRTPSPSGGEAA